MTVLGSPSPPAATPGALGPSTSVAPASRATATATPRHRAVLVLVAGLAAGAAVLWWGGVGALTAPSDEVGVPVWLLAVLFAVAEVFVVHVQVRRQAQTVSLSEVPLVLGLCAVDPAGLLAARIVGSLAVLVLHRRQRDPVKLAFNVALFTADLVVAVAVFHLVLGPAAPLDLRGWAALLVAAGAFGAFDAVAVAVVVALHSGERGTRGIVRQGADGGLSSLAVAAVALLAAHSLAHDARTGWLLAAAGVVLGWAYRAYGDLRERHVSLERLYRFSQVVAGDPDVDGILRDVMVQARDLLRAEVAEVRFVGADGAPSTSVRLDADGHVARSAGEPLPPGLVAGVSVLAARSTRDPACRAFLDGAGRRDAVAVPIVGGGGVVAALVVADRMGDVRTFDRADVLLLETVANHAGVALEKGRLIERLRHEALHDALTGLPNRSMLQARMEEAMADVAAGRIAGAATMLMDLDGFKEINDTLGHQHGDHLLVEVAARLLATSPDGATVARLGGDEFAILVPGVAGSAGARAAAERVLAALAEPFTVGGIAVEVRASVGVSLAPHDGDDPSDLLKRADIAMYEAKAGDRGYRLFEPDLDRGTPDGLSLLAELRRAIELDQVTVDLQPQASLDTGGIVAVEALARWRHPLRGFVPPDVFIPVAERSGLIRPLTRSVLRQSLAACASWRAAGHDIGVAVNLSARSLLDPELADDVAAALRHHDVPADRLTLELTESAVMTDPARAIALLTRLHDMGVRLSVDDFGTGYSSLSYLTRLPVQEVKIDRSFVLDMRTNADDATVVRSIIDLAGNLSLAVVAEGVEDEATWRTLAGMGCGVAQGYHLSRPVPAAAFLSWLDAREPRSGDEVLVLP